MFILRETTDYKTKKEASFNPYFRWTYVYTEKLYQDDTTEYEVPQFQSLF